MSASEKKKIGFVHLGCPKNLVDTETMLGILEKNNYTIVADESQADVMLVNTCAFIEKAQEESVQMLADLAESGKDLVIAGCLAQKFQKDLLEHFPEARAVVGIDNVAEIGQVMKRVDAGERVVAMQQDPTYLLAEDTMRRAITMGAYTYVKIAEGCDFKCAFCIIPSMRGAFRSRSVENIVENCRALAQQGLSEVVLVGQDNTSYGKDIGTNLPTLLRALNEIEELTWIRFMYAYPSLVTQELLETIRDCDKVVKYLDVPLQHSHPEILRRMNRPVTDLREFCAWVRAVVPEIRIRTTFISGFPGETDEHHAHLREAIRDIRFDRLGVFEYSDVDGARSNALDGKVPAAVAAARRNELMALQQQIAFEQNQALVEATLPVLIDMVNPYGMGIGRTQWDAPEVDNAVQVNPRAGDQLVPGELVSVRITHVTPYDLKGTPVG
ncbi:MAG: 30S ribosomal protein S12 methylthiotransferase RimO [Candidatus Melainabacteria bacterium]